MYVQLLVTLMTCVIADNVPNAAISSRNCVQCEDLRSEIESIRELLMTPQRACPFGFDYLPEAGSCFAFIPEGMTWNSATERCRGIMPGVHLAAITSQEENDATTRYIQSQFSKNGIGSPPYVNKYANGVWIGGQRRIPGQCDNPFVWKPLNGIQIPFNFTNWATGEPNCDRAGQNEPCVHIAPGIGHAWNDVMCSDLLFPLCEI